MLNRLKNEERIIKWRTLILFILFILMMGFMFFSRVLLSASMIAFVIVSFFHFDFKKQVSTFFSSPVLWGMGLLFLLPLISGLWSENKEQWLDIVRIKLPLLILPFAFAAPFEFSKKYWRWLIVFFIGFVTIATFWSMMHYINNVKAVNENYLRSQLLTTPMENDHVRFSWLVSVSVLLATWLWFQLRKEKKKISWLLSIVIVWQIVFLHLLAARTGLFSFYLMLFLAAIWVSFKKWKTLQSAGIIFILIVLPVAAYFTLPTFQNRVKYVLYDLPYFSKAHYKQGLNDATRIVSMKAGWNLMDEYPVYGVGFGDVSTETQKWYDANYPEMNEADKIDPDSEFLIYGAACGWIGLIIFCVAMIVPFFSKVKRNYLLWMLLNASVILTFLFDIGLEVQYGVFTYSFILLWWWKWLRE